MCSNLTLTDTVEAVDFLGGFLCSGEGGQGGLAVIAPDRHFCFLNNVVLLF